MQYRKKIICFCMALIMIIALLSTCACADSGYSDKVEQAQNSVVRVFVTRGSEIYSFGSGFAVGEAGEDVETIVTNYHVVEGYTDSVYVTTTDTTHGIKANVIHSDTENDIAILDLEREISDREPIALLSPKELHKSQTVYAIGFPFDADYYSNNQSFNSRIENMTITKGTVSNNEYTLEETKGILSDIKVNSGNSGGPMVDEYGQAVGINEALLPSTDNYGSSMSFAISMDYVMNILDYLHISYIKGSANGIREGDGLFSRLFSIIRENSTVTIIIAAVVLVAVIVLVVVLVVKSEKKNKNSRENDYNYDGTKTTVQRRLVVTCERGPLKGQSISSSGSIRVGRSGSTCRLVFPDDTPGVSKEHCEIYLTPGGIVISDLGSTYGTYLSDGYKLARGERRSVENGSIILLGSEKVILSVKAVY
jgi:hypothetical protein